MGSESLEDFSTLLYSSTPYEKSDLKHHEPICRTLSMELLQFHYSSIAMLTGTPPTFEDHRECPGAL